MSAHLIVSEFNGKVRLHVSPSWVPQVSAGSLNTVRAKVPLSDHEAELSIDALTVLYDNGALDAQRGTRR